MLKTGMAARKAPSPLGAAAVVPRAVFLPVCSHPLFLTVLRAVTCSPGVRGTLMAANRGLPLSGGLTAFPEARVQASRRVHSPCGTEVTRRSARAPDGTAVSRFRRTRPVVIHGLGGGFPPRLPAHHNAPRQFCLVHSSATSLRPYYLPGVTHLILSARP